MTFKNDKPMYTTRSGAKRFQLSGPIAEEAYKAMVRLARQQRTSLAAQLRKAVDEYIARNRPAGGKIG